MPDFKQQTTRPIQDPPDFVPYRTPMREPNPRADFGTPALQALLIAGAFGLLVFIVMLAVEGVTPRLAITWAAVCFLVVFIVLFLRYLNRAWDTIEMRYHRGAHKPEVRPIVLSRGASYKDPRSTVEEIGGQETDPECPYPEKTLKWFVWHLDHGQCGTGYKEWESVLGRSAYTRFRDTLINAGYARWLSYNADGEPNHTQGWFLALPADDVLKKIVEK